jgi:hypothetical protein
MSLATTSTNSPLVDMSKPLWSAVAEEPDAHQSITVRLLNTNHLISLFAPTI